MRIRSTAVTSVVAAFALALIGLGAADAVASVPNAFPTLRATIAGGPFDGTDFAGVSEYDPTNISGGTCCYAHTDVIDIATGGGTRHRAFALHLQAPTGQTFHTGMYYGDDVYGVRGDASVQEGGSDCEGVRFTITDLASSGTTVTRLDVQFQTSCNTAISNNDATIFGEVSFNEPFTAGTSTGARFLRWPDTPVGASTPVSMPFWVRNTTASPLVIGHAGRTGAQATDFRVASDGCSGHTLAAHTACAIQVVFHPTAAGARNAWLNIPVGARSITTQLVGTGSPGTTLLRIQSPAGAWVGGGGNHFIPNTAEPMHVSPTGPTQFVARLGDEGVQPETWTVHITAPRGRAVSAGSYSTSRDALFTYAGWGLDVVGNGQGCNAAVGHLTITQAQYDADQAPSVFHATFSFSCQDAGAGGTLTGEIEYHATA
ncbi:MAG: hypothetical protein ACTHMS_17940 [Jatrophihabitans sp.]|uniref:hypothetical protein n=1 Tax=Jatrophihabitans sp. TaxID=1932789 RepID=UPI003F7E0723